MASSDNHDQEPLQVVSVCRTANGYIIFGFANSLQSQAPELTKKAVQRLATRLGSEATNTGLTLLGDGGKRMYKHDAVCLTMSRSPIL